MSTNLDRAFKILIDLRANFKISPEILRTARYGLKFRTKFKNSKFQIRSLSRLNLKWRNI